MKSKTIISETGLVLTAILAIAVIIIVNSSFTNTRLDLTENKLFTLSDGTVNIVSSLEEPINLEFYFSRKLLTEEAPGIINYGNRVRDLLNEYVAESGGMVELTIIEPEPFSEEEDQAVASGLQGVPVNTAGDLAYFGLVSTNSIDDEEVIPFFQNEREASLEYDLTKMIYNLANPEKRVVGVMSGLPVFGNQAQQQFNNPMAQQQRPWAIINVMREFFEVRNIDTTVESINDDIDVLMVIHPKDLSDKTLFAIDQYLLKGGKAMFFVDPFADADSAQPNPQNPMVMPSRGSSLKTLLDTWGVEIMEGKIVGDISRAMRVQTRGPRGPEETTYLPWLRLDRNNFNQEDFSTNELDSIHLGSAGVINRLEGSSLEFTPLMETTEDSMLIDSSRLLFQPDPGAFLDEFIPGNRKLVVAARLGGNAGTAFPDGVTSEGANNETGEEATEPAATDHIKEGRINAILVADTDILSDFMWIRMQSFFGMEIPQTLANNGDFIINSLDNLSGNNDLISLRTRGNYSRPFTRVEEIRRQAESEFRDRERELQAKLEETEQRLLELQQETSGSELILSPEQTAEIEKFRQEQINTRKELRNVQHELQKNIERLGTQLKFINIGLIPLLIAVLAVAAGFIHNRRHQ